MLHDDNGDVEGKDGGVAAGPRVALLLPTSPSSPCSHRTLISSEPLDLCLHRHPSLHHPHSLVVNLTTPSAPLEVSPPLSPVALSSCGPKSTPVIILVVYNLVS
jgi:hypothetical protein